MKTKVLQFMLGAPRCAQSLFFVVVFFFSVFTDNGGMFLVFIWLRMISMLLDAVYSEVQKMQKTYNL